MPKPKKGERKKTFIKRCIPYLYKEEPDTLTSKKHKNKQAYAICNSLYDDKNKKKNENILSFKKFINESWFNKKTDIEKVQEEEIDDNNIEKIKKELTNNIDNFDKYKDAYFNYLKINKDESNKYFKLATNSLIKSTIELYKLSKIHRKYPDKINEKYLNSVKNKIFDLYHKINVNDFDFPKLCKKLIEIVYFLNRISKLMDNNRERFIINKTKKSGFINQYEIIDKLEDTTEKYNL